MDILRNLFGSLTSGIIRLLVTVGIVAAVGYFLVKPALETTERISKEANTSFEKSFGENGANNIAKQIQDANRQVQRQVRRSLKMARKQGGRQSSKLLKCVQRAHQDVKKIERCTLHF